LPLSRRLNWARRWRWRLGALILCRLLRASGLRTLRLRGFIGSLLSGPRRLRTGVVGLCVSLLRLAPLGRVLLRLLVCILLRSLICILLRSLPLRLLLLRLRSGAALSR
jgi:hypothetical protein